MVFEKLALGHWVSLRGLTLQDKSFLLFLHLNWIFCCVSVVRKKNIFWPPELCAPAGMSLQLAVHFRHVCQSLMSTIWLACRRTVTPLLGWWCVSPDSHVSQQQIWKSKCIFGVYNHRKSFLMHLAVSEKSHPGLCISNVVADVAISQYHHALRTPCACSGKHCCANSPAFWSNCAVEYLLFG